MRHPDETERETADRHRFEHLCAEHALDPDSVHAYHVRRHDLRRSARVLLSLRDDPRRHGGKSFPVVDVPAEVWEQVVSEHAPAPPVREFKFWTPPPGSVAIRILKPGE